ncbi:MAG: L,D-transpeptidase [Deltaproteobacteria bacterium]|nr:L,D-transpeptidase [Deltaproteobacteria bacterium]
MAGKRLGELGTAKNSLELGLGELFGAESDAEPAPFWLRGNERLIHNVSEFEVPDYALFADRARRKTGLAFVGSFATGPESLQRRFAITTDLRLAPTSKVKPDSGSPWHGVELGGGLDLPLAFVRGRGAQAYRLGRGAAAAVGDLEHRSVHRLTGRAETVQGEPYYATAGERWLRGADVAAVVPPAKWPEVARQGQRWIEVDLSDQYLVLWEGTRAVFATLVSTGRPAIGDPETTTATPRGVFRIRAKHVTATMDSDEGSAARLNQQKGLRPGDEEYVPSRGDGIYGVLRRRGEGLFKLRDVPHIQYFATGYAIHGAYWHDVLGIPRSHGCINLAPADSLRLFHWTEPAVPEGWHGVRALGDEGTVVVIHK